MKDSTNNSETNHLYMYMPPCWSVVLCISKKKSWHHYDVYGPKWYRWSLKTIGNNGSHMIYNTAVTLYKEQDKSSDIEQQPPFGDRKISNIQHQNRGGVYKTNRNIILFWQSIKQCTRRPLTQTQNLYNMEGMREYENQFLILFLAEYWQ